MISKETATGIAFAYREIETAQSLLDSIKETIGCNTVPDIRDAFGRSPAGLQLGVPSGNTGHRLFNVPWSLAKPIIETHIAQQRAVITTLTEKARLEMDAP